MMRAQRFFLVLAVAGLAACAEYEWADTAPDGTKLSAAQSSCRAQAQDLVRRYRTFDSYQPGPAGFPPDSPRDMEMRETERCLAARGFEKRRID